MSVLFEPYDLCGIALRNRFIRSATMENMATAGKSPSSSLMTLYENLARGGVGLILTSSVRPDRSWDRSPDSGNLCIDADAQIPAFMELTSRVHDAGGKVAIQLGSFYRFDGEYVAPSPVAYPDSAIGCPRELKRAEIGRIVEKYGQAAYRARSAGFDAIQVHAAHGFPLCRFLSPLFNRRPDEYGGSAANRSRIVQEITREIRKNSGDEFPVFIKINVADFCSGGMTVEDAIKTAKILCVHGISAIETSGGCGGHSVTELGPLDPAEWSEEYFAPYAAAIKTEVPVPVILVGGLRDLHAMQNRVRQGQADLLSMSRPFIREPQLIRRWAAGDEAPAECVSCNGCLDVVRAGGSLHCVLD